MGSIYPAIRNKQQGVSLSGLLIWSVIIVLVAILGMRLVPSFIEYAAIKRALMATASDPDLQNAAARELRLAFDKRAAIDEIKSVSGRDIVINKQNTQVMLSVSYAVKKPLFANVSLLIDFEAASNQ
jgi:hypothetical protein